MAECSIRACSCVNPFMDKAYGQGMRVYNPTTKGLRCCSCLKEIKVETPKKGK